MERQHLPTTIDEGVAVFSSFRVVDSSTKWLPYAHLDHAARAAVRLGIDVNGVTVQVFGVHLQVGNASARNSSMTMLKAWGCNYAAPQLAAGDFNADPDQIRHDSRHETRRRGLVVACRLGRGLTCNTPSPTMKLDYWFADASGRARVEWTYVNTGTGTVSDHFPVVASFVIR